MKYEVAVVFRRSASALTCLVPYAALVGAHFRLKLRLVLRVCLGLFPLFTLLKLPLAPLSGAIPLVRDRVAGQPSLPWVG